MDTIIHGGCGRAGNELLGDESAAERESGDTRPDENENGGDEATDSDGQDADYEYDEDEEYVELNDESLLQLKRNDPDLAALKVYFGSRGLDARDINWGENGNCIALAISRLTGAEAVAAARVSEDIEGIRETRLLKARTYRQCAALLGVRLVPALRINYQVNGKWLLHTVGRGRPHCIAVEF